MVTLSKTLIKELRETLFNLITEVASEELASEVLYGKEQPMTYEAMVQDVKFKNMMVKRHKDKFFEWWRTIENMVLSVACKVPQDPERLLEKIIDDNISKVAANHGYEYKNVLLKDVTSKYEDRISIAFNYAYDHGKVRARHSHILLNGVSRCVMTIGWDINGYYVKDANGDTTRNHIPLASVSRYIYDWIKEHIVVHDTMCDEDAQY